MEIEYSVMPKVLLGAGDVKAKNQPTFIFYPVKSLIMHCLRILHKFYI